MVAALEEIPESRHARNYASIPLGGFLWNTNETTVKRRNHPPELHQYTMTLPGTSPHLFLVMQLTNAVHLDHSDAHRIANR